MFIQAHGLYKYNEYTIIIQGTHMYNVVHMYVYIHTVSPSEISRHKQTDTVIEQKQHDVSLREAQGLLLLFCNCVYLLKTKRY